MRSARPNAGVAEDRPPDEPRRRKRRSRRKTCPTCKKADEVVEILYGMPDLEARDARDRGEIELGGCCVMPDQPTKHCKRCDESF